MTLAINLTKVLVDMDEEKHQEISSDPMTGFKVPVGTIFSLTEPNVCAVRPVDGVDGDDNDNFKLSDLFLDSLAAFFHQRFNIVNDEDEINDVLLGLTKHLTTRICHVYQSLNSTTEEDARFVGRIVGIRQECQKHNVEHPDDIMLPAVELCW